MGNQYGDGFMCKCAQYYYGILCSYYSVACDPTPCMNGGTCHIDTTDPDNQWCACPDEWSGATCQEAATEATPTLAPEVEEGDHTFNNGVLSAIVIGSVFAAAVAIFALVKFVIIPKYAGSYSVSSAAKTA